VQEIEQEEDEGGGVAAVGRQLDHAERGNAVGSHAAQFAVEIGLAGAERRDGLSDRRIFVRPLEPGARQKAHGAAIEARMHAVAVELDFVEPLIAFRRRADQLGELGPDPLRQSRRLGARPARYRPHYGGRGLVRRSMGFFMSE
jgi:hypothetical protein